MLLYFSLVKFTFLINFEHMAVRRVAYPEIKFLLKNNYTIPEIMEDTRIQNEGYCTPPPLRRGGGAAD